MNETLYYPVEVEYVGPSDKGHLGHKIQIQRQPGRANMSGELKTSGWLGTTDDWNREALGEMTADQVRELLKRRGIQIPDSSPIKFTDYSLGHKDSEWYNKRFAY